MFLKETRPYIFRYSEQEKFENKSALLDFQDHFVIAAFMGRGGFTGEWIEIINITQSEDEILVTADFIHETIGSLVEVYPFHIVKIDKSELVTAGNLTLIYSKKDGTEISRDWYVIDGKDKNSEIYSQGGG